MSKFDENEDPHMRFNPLKDDWVLVSPHRMKRPWNGQIEKPQDFKNLKNFDPKNPLCPGVTRPNGEKNLDYNETFVFENDFPALLNSDKEDDTANRSTDISIDASLFKVQPVSGNCKVMCFHPHTNVTLPLMTIKSIVSVIDKWIELLNSLSTQYDWVQIFENKGEINGCSNPHPHCQIWSTNFLPNEIRVKNQTQKSFYEKHNKVMLVEYVQREMNLKKRIVVENENWIVLVPYWATWPYETMLLPKRHVVRLQDLNKTEIASLASIMKRLLTKYDNLFKCSFPYSMGWHCAPFGKYLNENHDWWQLHALYYPPLLRSSTVRKFMVGFELLCQAQRDLTPEKAASDLNQQSDTIHYTELFEQNFD